MQHEAALITSTVSVVMLVLLVTDRLRSDLVALLGALVLGATGVLTQAEVFSGFSRSAVVTIMAVFILTEGLQRTGANDLVGRFLVRMGGRKESRLLVVVMVGGAVLSLFMNNIAAAAVLLPAVSAASTEAGVPPSRLLIPLAYSTLLGGMATLLTSSNVIAGSLLRAHGYGGFGLADFAPVGIPMALAGILFMATVGRRLLPEHGPAERDEAVRQAEEDLVALYRLGERLFRVKIPVGSALDGRMLSESGLREAFGVSVVAVRRKGEEDLVPAPHTRLHAGDEVLLRGNLGDFRGRDREPYLEILSGPEPESAQLQSGDVVVAEAMLGPRSDLIGRTLPSCRFRQRFGVNVLAVWRAGRQIRTGLRDLVLAFGDALLLQGHREQVDLLHSGPDLILMRRPSGAARTRGRRALAMAVMAGTLLLAALRPEITAEIMLGGGLVMLLLGLMSMDEAYQAIEWKTVFTVAGMLSLGTALTKSGVAQAMADGTVQLLGAWGPVPLMLGLFAMAASLTQAVNGTAVAVVMVPVAIQAAVTVGVDPRAFAMAAALGSSMAFVTPLGHPVDMLVMGRGGYTFRDYAKVGIPLVLVLSVVVALVLPRAWPVSGRYRPNFSCSNSMPKVELATTAPHSHEEAHCAR